MLLQQQGQLQVRREVVERHHRPHVYIAPDDAVELGARSPALLRQLQKLAVAALGRVGGGSAGRLPLPGPESHLALELQVGEAAVPRIDPAVDRGAVHADDVLVEHRDLVGRQPSPDPVLDVRERRLGPPGLHVDAPARVAPALVGRPLGDLRLVGEAVAAIAAVAVLPAPVAYPRRPCQRVARGPLRIGGAEVAAVPHVAPGAERAFADALRAHAHALAPATVAAGSLAGPEGPNVPVLAHLPRHGRGAPADEARYGAERVAPVKPILYLLPFLKRQLPVSFVHGSFLSATNGKVWRLSTIAGKGLFVKFAVRSGQMALAHGRGLTPNPLSN